MKEIDVCLDLDLYKFDIKNDDIKSFVVRNKSNFKYTKCNYYINDGKIFPDVYENYYYFTIDDNNLLYLGDYNIFLGKNIKIIGRCKIDEKTNKICYFDNYHPLHMTDYSVFFDFMFKIKNSDILKTFYKFDIFYPQTSLNTIAKRILEE